MESLNSIYKESFFGKRYKLHWRAPIFCKAVESEIDFKSVVDVGCADGDLVKQWVDDGYDAYGLEGSISAAKFSVAPQARQIWHDMRIPIFPLLTFDLVVSLEVAEHIEPEYTDVYVENMVALNKRNSDTGILLSAATPGQGGHYHVNCQLPEYWEEKFGRHRYKRNTIVENNIKSRIAPWKDGAGIKAFYHNLLYFQ